MSLFKFQNAWAENTVAWNKQPKGSTISEDTQIVPILTIPKGVYPDDLALYIKQFRELLTLKNIINSIVISIKILPS